VSLGERGLSASSARAPCRESAADGVPLDVVRVLFCDGIAFDKTYVHFLYNLKTTRFNWK
jgi:hypothetical protein